MPSPPARVDESDEAHGLDTYSVVGLIRRRDPYFVPSWEEFVEWNVLDNRGQEVEWLWSALFSEVMEDANFPYFARPRTWQEWVTCYRHAIGVDARDIVVDIQSGVGHVPVGMQRGLIARRPVSGDILVAWARDAAYYAVTNELFLPVLPAPAATTVDDEASEARCQQNTNVVRGSKEVSIAKYLAAPIIVGRVSAC